MRSLILCIALCASLIGLSSCSVVQAQPPSAQLTTPAVDPSICLREAAVSYECNCHSCQCQSCHSCGCSAHYLWGSCSYDSCSGCWCSGWGCKCCYSSDCRYDCDCQQCCDTCQRIECAETQSYHTTFLLPLEGPVTGGSSIVVHGAGFSHTGAIQCRFGPTLQVEGVWIDTTRIGCTSPPAPGGALGAVAVEVSLDGGVGWTVNDLQFTFSNCTSCSSDCEPGRAGSQCTLACDDSCIAQGHGKCLTALDATGAEQAFCLCNQGWWTNSTTGAPAPAPSQNQSCAAECPGGSATPCNGNGLCDGTTGACDCAQSHWGPACENTCPGAVGSGATMKPCSAHGVCDTAGRCECLGGWWGADCSQPCPSDGSLSGLPCKGLGICDKTNGTCACNPPYSGPFCQFATCPDPTCNDHGDCDATTGVCGCRDGWSDPRCATPPPPSADHGIIGFVALQQLVSENAGSVQIGLQRLGGSSGSVTAICSTVGGTAQPGLDFFALSNVSVSWGDGDSAIRNLSVLIIQDAASEPAESFSVQIESLGGLALLDAARSRMRIDIAASTTPPELAQIDLEFNIRWASHGSDAAFIAAFVSQMTAALGLSSDRLVAVQSLSSAEQGLSTGLQFLLFGDAETGGSGQRVTSLVRKLLQQGIEPLGSGTGIFASQPLLQQIDYTHEPVILLKTTGEPVDPSPSPTPGGGHKGWVVALVVASVLLLLCAVGGFVAYRKRVQLSEWALYRLGRFRFSRFKDAGAAGAAAGGDADDDEEGGAGHEQHSGPLAGADALSPASGSRRARGGPTEMALRRDEERPGNLLVD